MAIQNVQSPLIKLGLFNLRQAEEVGVSHQDVYRLLARNEIHRIARGLYIHNKAILDADVGFQIACIKFGENSVISGLSALFHYNLAEQVPEQTWIAVPPEVKSQEKQYRLMRTKTPATTCSVMEKGYRIVTVERAILDAMKFSSKMGYLTALKAAREAIKARMTSESKLVSSAIELQMENVLKKFYEALIA